MSQEKCKHCGTNISQQKVWPSGSTKWVDIHAVVAGAFCPGRDGEDHEVAEPFDAVGFIMAFESGELKPSEVIVGMSELTKSGDIWNLQGSYGRAAQGFIDSELFDDQGTLSDLGQEIADGLYDGVNVEDDYS